MSLPDEKRRTLIAVYDWMLRLPFVKRVPKELKVQAVRLMRHYPSPTEIKSLKMFEEQVPPHA